MLCFALLRKEMEELNQTRCIYSSHTVYCTGKGGPSQVARNIERKICGRLNYLYLFLFLCFKFFKKKIKYFFILN